MEKNSVSSIYYRNFHDNSASHTGLHKCCFSTGSKTSLEAAKDFITTGIKEEHKIIYIASEKTIPKILQFLQNSHISPDVWGKDEQLNFFSAEDIYIQDGSFSPSVALKFWQEQLQNARKKGFSAVRAIIDMGWSLDVFGTLDDIIKYEATIAANLGSKPKFIALCIYDTTILPPGFLNKAIESHPFCKFENEIHANPYFIAPNEYLGPDKEIKLFKQRSHEIRERRKTEEELFRLYKQIDGLNDFTHMLVHDLKEPIRHANMLNDMALGDPEHTLSDSLQKLLKRVSKALKEAYKRIEGLQELNFSSKNGSKQRIDLNKAILRNIKEHEKTLNKISGKIIFQPTAVGFIKTKGVYISQLFENIIGNSIKYRKKDLSLIINIKTESHHPGTVDIKIADNGAGFNACYNMQIFRPFRRLHSSLEYEGSGIGLTICQRIMQESKGEIFAEGQEGKGTTITLRFPLEEKKREVAA